MFWWPRSKMPIKSGIASLIYLVNWTVFYKVYTALCRQTPQLNLKSNYASSLSIQRIANSLRQGRMADIGLERFVEALTDKEAGLTYPALTGIRKQSVQDVERLFGYGVIQFMDKHGYENEAKLLNVVRNWRRAIDERGLMEQQRQEFLQDLLDYICCDLMPWYAKGMKDFSLLEINRYLKVTVIYRYFCL